MGKKVLFLDDRYIASSLNIVRVFHKWEKDSKNPIITKEYEWEGIGPYAPSVFKSKDGKYGMWIGTFGGKENDYPAGFMTSSDALNWEKRPEMTDAIDDGAQACTCIYDEGRRFGKYKYLSLTIYRETKELPFRIGFKRSEDAMHWEDFDGSPYRTLASDVISCMWDEVRQKYVLYYKLWKLAGTTVEGSEFCAYFPAFLPETDKNTFRARGLAVLPEIKKIDVTLKYDGGSDDDGGGGIASKSVTMVRIIARAESENFIDWHNQQVIIEPPENAPLGDQTYGMNVQRYGGMYIAHLSHFNGIHGHIRPLLAWSYDGVNFSINYDSFALECGEPGTWDAGMVLSTVFLEDVGGKMCLYYGAINKDHKVNDNKITTGNIGRAWMRRDGFASIKGGEITTVSLDINGPLTLNMIGKIGVKLQAEGISMSGTAVGDGTDVAPDIDFSAFVGKKAVVTLDLRDGELFSLNIG